VAELRAQQITQWITDRRGSAKMQAQRHFLASTSAAWLEHGALAPATVATFKSEFSALAADFGYRAATLVDSKGRPFLSTREVATVNTEEFKAAADAMQTGKVVVSDFHPSVEKDEKDWEIDVEAPIYGPGK